MITLLKRACLASCTASLLFAGAVSASAIETVPSPQTTTSDVKTPAADVACFASAAKLPGDQLSAFLDKPQQLLIDNPGGGLPMSNRVRSLAGSSKQASDQLMQLVSTANRPQKSAIGSGLGRVVAACKDSNPEFADMITQSVVDSSDVDVLAGFAGANSDVSVASIAGATSSALGGGTVGSVAGQRSASNGYTYGGNETYTNTAPGLGSVNPSFVDSQTGDGADVSPVTNG